MSPSQPFRLDGSDPVLPRPRAAGSSSSSQNSGASFATQPIASPITTRVPPPAPNKPMPAANISPRRTPRNNKTLLTIGLSAVGVLLLLGGAYAYLRVDPHVAAEPAPAPPPNSAPVSVSAPSTSVPVAPTANTGVVMVDTRPEGSEVTVDGHARGVTPIRLSLSIGDHLLEFRDGAGKRSVPLTVAAGTVLSEHFDLSAPLPAAPAAPAISTAAPAGADAGRLEITSTPAGAQVTIDDAPRGVTPLTIAAIAPGSHSVVVSNGDSTVTNTVTVTAGATATVTASMTSGVSGAGWVSIKTPFEMQVLEAGKVVGSTSLDRIMLPPGKHDFDLVSAAFDFKTSVTVHVRPGKTETPAVAIPNGSVSINVQPWADVWLDGQALGTTPLANLSVPIGNHEIVWKHPQLGERKRTIAVTAQAPMRLGLNFTDR